MLNSHKGLTVEVYRNLHKGCYSIRHRGLVIAHADWVSLSGVKLVVQKSGQKRVRDTGQKVVHAFARGTLCDYIERGEEGSLYRPVLATGLTYNPYTMDTFQTREGQEAFDADTVVMGPRVFEGTGVSGRPQKVAPGAIFAEAFEPVRGDARSAACLDHELSYGTELE
jgi:hypothetical protein